LPNRFFKASLGLYVFGSTDGVALLSDDSTLVGQNATLQPRLGFAYKAVEFKQLTVELEAGTYLEVMRTAGDPSRLHGTVGLEVKPWVINLGWAMDQARYYQDFIFSVGVDLGKLLSRLGLIPPLPQYPYGGVFPDPVHLSDAGLGHALDSGWKQRDDNVIHIGLKMPRKIQQKINTAPQDLREFGGDLIEGLRELPGDVRSQSSELIQRTMGVLPLPKTGPEDRREEPKSDAAPAGVGPAR
jgi:hypothetical protein